MTIASEITRIKGNIAGAYSALEEKGATLPETQNSANLAATIGSVPAGGGDTVTAVNYTGAAIAEGDKVWLNKNANVSASAVSVSGNTSISSTVFPMDATGTSVYYTKGSYNYKYDTASATTSAISTSIEYSIGYYGVYYDEYNNMYVANKIINASGCTTTELYYTQANYAAGNKTDGYRFHLYRVDKANNFAITKDWTVYSSKGNSSPSSVICVIGDKMYYSEVSGGYRLIATLDENATQINTSERSDKYMVVHSTADDKLAICTTVANGGSYYKGWGSIKLVSVNNDYTLGNDFISANSDLNNLLAQSPVCFTFNRVTGVLCISRYDVNSPYGIFKYENGDFTTIAVTLTNTSGQNWQGYYAMFVSNDLSKVQYGNMLFNLEQSADGTYKAIPYSYAMGSQTLTGVATQAAANGESFEATTIVAG